MAFVNSTSGNGTRKWHGPLSIIVISRDIFTFSLPTNSIKDLHLSIVGDGVEQETGGKEPGHSQPEGTKEHCAKCCRSLGPVWRFFGRPATGAMSRLSRAAVHCRSPMVEGRRNTSFFLSTLNPIFVQLNNYTDLTRSETPSILSHRWVSKIFYKYSSSLLPFVSDRNVPALFDIFAKKGGISWKIVSFDKITRISFAKIAQIFAFTRKSPNLFWFCENFRKNNKKIY
jgi:hypothetical protein